MHPGRDEESPWIYAQWALNSGSDFESSLGDSRSLI